MPAVAARKLSLDDQLCFALYAATNAITRSYRPGLDLLGITYPQYLLLLCLWQDGPSTTGAIARRLALAPNAITPLVDRLERGGFVERHRDEGDRRVVHRVAHEGGELTTGLGIEFQDVDEAARETLLRYFTPERYTQFYETMLNEFPHIIDELQIPQVSLVLNLWEEWKVRQAGGPAATSAGAPPATKRRKR